MQQAHQGSYFAQPHVRPVLIAWSRSLALVITLLAGAAMIGGGFIMLVNWIMHSLILVVIFLVCFTALGLALWLPTLLPTLPPAPPK